MIRIVWAFFLGLGMMGAAGAQEAAQEGKPEPAEDKPAVPQLKFRTGQILLPNKVATLDLTPAYRYLDPPETEKMLVAWGNPPGNETLGAVAPAAIDPFDEEKGWAVILTYMDDGHVDDADAKEIDYDDLLKDMKSGTKAENKERVKAGYGAIELVGWAAHPHYDAASHKLYWAKELKFGDGAVNTLNYDVRVLGREGVLSMNAVASMPQLADIETDMKDLLQVASFNPGQRYEDYEPGNDKLAAYGLGALVAGGLAAKAGLFAKLGVMLLAFKKFIIIGLVALGGLLTRIFRKKEPA